MNKRIQMLYYVAFDTAPTKDWHLMIEVFVLPLRFSTIGNAPGLTQNAAVKQEVLGWLVEGLREA